MRLPWAGGLGLMVVLRLASTAYALDRQRVRLSSSDVRRRRDRSASEFVRLPKRMVRFGTSAEVCAYLRAELAGLVDVGLLY